TPHVSVFVRRDVDGARRPGKGLTAGIASTRPIEPEELGTLVHVGEVARAVQAGMSDAGITDPTDVHFVQIKCPLLTAEAIADATAAGKRVATTSTYASMGYSRAAAALGGPAPPAEGRAPPPPAPGTPRRGAPSPPWPTTPPA